MNASPQGRIHLAIVGAHRDNPGAGCAFSALAAEIARSDKRTWALASEQLENDLQLIAGLFADKNKCAARSKEQYRYGDPEWSKYSKSLRIRDLRGWTVAMNSNQWARLLAFITGLVNQELLLQNEYLVAESRILRAHLPPRLPLSDPELHAG